MALEDGAWVGPEGKEVKILGLFFADDMVLISDTEVGFQCLLNIVGRFGVQQRLQFSPEKCKAIVNGRKPIHNRGWSLGGIDIKEGGKGHVQIQIDETGEYKYVGIFIFMNTVEIVKKAQRTSYLVKMVGDQSGGLIWVMNKV